MVSQYLLYLFLMSWAFAFGQSSDLSPVEHYASYPEISDPSDLVKKGEYLTKLGDCIACHTADHGDAFAGGKTIKPVLNVFGFELPIGTFYGPNITPDQETGIGQWTDEAFLRAFRYGEGQHGENLFPAFPYVFFTKVTDDDILSIKSYLDQVPAISRPNQPHELYFPFSWRFLQTFWKWMFFTPGEFKADESQTDQWNRGAYLVEGLAHCGMCHTPTNMFGNWRASKAYTGSMVDGWYAPNITGTNLQKVTVDQIVRVFMYDERPSGGAIHGPMKEVNHDSLQYVDRSDLEAIAVYIKSTQDAEAQKRTDEIKESSGGQKIKQLYNLHCSTCHSMGAGGAPKFGDQSQWQSRIDARGKDGLIYSAIHGYGNMPAMGGCYDCSEEDIEKMVEYMLDALPAIQVAQRTMGLAPKTLTAKDGQNVYDETCHVCHADGKLGAPKVGDRDQWQSRLDAQGFLNLVRSVIQPEYYQTQPGDCEAIRGACMDCNDAEIMAAVKYMLEESQVSGNFDLW